MQIKPNMTYGISVSYGSRRRKRRSRGGGKKFIAALIIVILAAACYGFVKFGIWDMIIPSGRAQSYIEQGDSCMAEGDYKSALDYYIRAGETDKNSADADAAMGDAYFKLGQTADAKKAYLSSLKLSDTCTRAYTGLINLYIAQGRAGDARSLLAQAKGKGLQIDDSEWNSITADVPKKSTLSLGSGSLTVGDAHIRFAGGQVEYTPGGGEKRVIYTGSPSSKFVTDGVSLYIYDKDDLSIVHLDIPSGLYYKLADTYKDADKSSEFYGGGSFCGVGGGRYIYFVERRAEAKYLTYLIDTQEDKYSLIKNADIMTILGGKDSLCFLSHSPGLYTCGFDGSGLKEISPSVKEYNVIGDMVIYTQPVGDNLVDVWTFDMNKGSAKNVASDVSMTSVNTFHEDRITYYGVNEETLETELKTLYF